MAKGAGSQELSIREAPAGVLELTDATKLFHAILRDQRRTNAELSLLADLFPDTDAVWNLPHAQMGARSPCLSEAA
jgi:hypothetical protein